MLIFCYLAKRSYITMAAFVAFLSMLMISHQMIAVLNMAANGNIPAVYAFKLIILEFPMVLWLVLPLACFMGLILTFNSLCHTREMTALQACGYSPAQLLTHSLILASFVAILAAVVIMWLRPLVEVARYNLLHPAELQTLAKTFAPQQFRALKNDNMVLYGEEKQSHPVGAKQILLARKQTKNNEDAWDITWIQHAFIEKDALGHDYFLVMENVSRYQGEPGRADFKLIDYKTVKQRLYPPQSVPYSSIRTEKTMNLWPPNNKDNLKASELQWRLSVPIMIFLLAIIAVGLGFINTRQDKYSNVLPAIIIFVLYANCVTFCRRWIIAGSLPPWLGVWWLHGLVFVVGVLLYFARSNCEINKWLSLLHH